MIVFNAAIAAGPLQSPFPTGSASDKSEQSLPSSDKTYVAAWKSTHDRKIILSKDTYFYLACTIWYKYFPYTRHNNKKTFLRILENLNLNPLSEAKFDSSVKILINQEFPMDEKVSSVRGSVSLGMWPHILGESSGITEFSGRPLWNWTKSHKQSSRYSTSNANISKSNFLPAPTFTAIEQSLLLG